MFREEPRYGVCYGACPLFGVKTNGRGVGGTGCGGLLETAVIKNVEQES